MPSLVYVGVYLTKRCVRDLKSGNASTRLPWIQGRTASAHPTLESAKSSYKDICGAGHRRRTQIVSVQEQPQPGERCDRWTKVRMPVKRAAWVYIKADPELQEARSSAFQYRHEEPLTSVLVEWDRDARHMSGEPEAI